MKQNLLFYNGFGGRGLIISTTDYADLYDYAELNK